MLLLENMSYEILKYSKCALLASGTITLEASLLLTPAVVTYSLPTWMYFLAKRLVKVPFISLPNLILNKRVYPEILQEKSNPFELASAIEQTLERSEEIRNTLKSLQSLLGNPGVTWRIAEEILKFIQNLKKY